jgi:uncharacterized protein (TIGR02300 family)
MLGRPELGCKCTCAGCHERFYDLKRSPVVCPKCGARQPPATRRELCITASTGLKSSRSPKAVTIDDDIEPVDTPELEADGDGTEPDDEVDDEVEIDAGPPKAAG